MSNRKFHALFVIWLMILVALFAGGCGGSSGGSLGIVDNNPTPTPIPEPIVSPDPTPTPTPTPEPIVSPDPTPTPTPTPEPIISPDPEPEIPSALVEAEYALSHIAIGYQAGDNPNYVTRNLILPVSAEVVEGVTITWISSNPSTISVAGNVNRQAADTNVTLTARAVKDSESAEKNFSLVVIRRRSRTVEQAKAEIQTIGVTEIRSMNTSNDELQITYTESRDRVTDIDGKYTDMTISTADDALDAVQSLHGILGINDPYQELEANVITFDTYGAEYTFSQVYDGVRVFGRNVTVSANSAGEGDFIASSIMPSAKLAESNLNFTYTKDQAENAAKNHYAGSFDVRPDITEKVIFSLYEYENNPVPAYVVSVYGVDDDGGYLDENVFVNALNGDVIFASTNIHDANTRTANDELGNPRTFPVISLDILGKTYQIFTDTETNVEAYNREIGIFWGRYNHVNFDEHDEQQVSAYANMIDVIKWWKASFDRNSLDGNGMTVKVITHKSGMTDNASWSNSDKLINVYDASSNARSDAAAVDVIAHESTHAVVMYTIGYDFAKNYECNVNRATGNGIATGAINEGYADIFGCLMTRQWKHALHVYSDDRYERNIEDPTDGSSRQNQKVVPALRAPVSLHEVREPYMYQGEIYDHGGVHINSSIVSYPAYLMHQDHNHENGLTWNELAQLWYKSMRMGYNATSTFKTVRKCVMRAARKLNMPEGKIDAIQQAFEDVGLGAEKCTLQGTVSKYDGGALSGIRVTANKQSNGIMYMSVLTDANGQYSMDLYADKYTVNIDASGYVPFSTAIQLEEGADNILNIPLVTPTGAHTSTITGTLRDALTSYAVGGGELRIWRGWNTNTGYTVAETLIDDDGTYSLPLFAGYYTAEYSKEGYATTSIKNFVISSDETLSRDIILSPTSDNKYRVTLQWNRTPKYLDSHLIGSIANSTGNPRTFHVYYVTGYRTAYDSDGNIIAMIEQNDSRSYGFETITFEMKPFDKFTYYVHWYSENGTTWTGTNAVVNLYKGSQLINTFTVPQVNEYGYWKYWHVFDITDGLDPVKHDTISGTEPTVNGQSNLFGAGYYPRNVR